MKPKGQENKIYTIVKGRETFYRRHTAPVTSCSEVKYVLKRVSFGSKDCTKELKPECAHLPSQTSQPLPPRLGLMCLAQGQNAVSPVRLEPAALRSRVKHSTTGSLHSLQIDCIQSIAGTILTLTFDSNII